MFQPPVLWLTEHGELGMSAEARLRLECLKVAARTTGVGGDGRESASSSSIRLQLIAEDLVKYVIEGRCDGTRR